jgi:chromosomal replication initiator protein
MFYFVQSIRSNDVMTFKEKMRSIDVLIVDDLQFVAGKESTQQEFMNSFNSLVEDNKQVILVCDRSPLDLENIDEKLKSRITSGMIVNFKRPDFQDRLEIVRSKVKIMEQEICEKVLNYIAEKINGSIRDLEGALKKLVANRVFLKEEISLETAKNILHDYTKSAKTTAPNIAKIQKTVAEFYGVKLIDLSSNNRSRAISRPRQIAMYLAKNLTTESLPKIGAAFGGKNHATVIHSVKLVQGLMDDDMNLAQEVKMLEEKIL